jgi:WXG100 family type VII secretion target
MGAPERSGGDDGDYVIDLEELDSVIARLENCEQALETLSTDIEKQMSVLHETWEGLSAQAQREAQEEWDQGLTDMREALADMRQAARTAEHNYRLAIKTNQSLWSGLT